MNPLKQNNSKTFDVVMLTENNLTFKFEVPIPNIKLQFSEGYKLALEKLNDCINTFNAYKIKSMTINNKIYNKNTNQSDYNPLIIVKNALDKTLLDFHIFSEYSFNKQIFMFLDNFLHSYYDFYFNDNNKYIDKCFCQLFNINTNINIFIDKFSYLMIDSRFYDIKRYFLFVSKEKKSIIYILTGFVSLFNKERKIMHNNIVVENLPPLIDKYEDKDKQIILNYFNNMIEASSNPFFVCYDCKKNIF